MAETTNWLEIPTVEDHLKEATRIVGQFAEASFDEWMRDQLASPRLSAGAQLESPLEALFYLWWNAIAGPDSQWYFKLALVPQQEVVVQDERFRLDFVVDLNVEYEESFGAAGLTWPLIAVEVDGHGFHEKTREQVAYRNHRDRLLQQAGWMVFHFSWSEMTTRPLECVGEVFGVARLKWQELMMATARRKTAERAAENQAGAQTSQES